MKNKLDEAAELILAAGLFIVGVVAVVGGVILVIAYPKVGFPVLALVSLVLFCWAFYRLRGRIREDLKKLWKSH